MLKCSALGCPTNENTQINGKTLTLFSFPSYDDSLFEQWEENSKVTKVSDEKNKTELKLCELHFESDCFVSKEKNALAPGAVPKIFEFNNKRKNICTEEPELELKEPPLKQIKSQKDDEESSIVTNPLNNLPIEMKSEGIIDESEKPVKEDNLGSIIADESKKRNLTKDNGISSVFTKQIDMGKKVYRLIIRIDKVIIDKKQDIPSSENIKEIEKKPEAEKKEEEQNNKRNVEKLINLDIKTVAEDGLVKPCTKTGCKLIKTFLSEKPVFKCEICGKYYIIKENNNDDGNKKKNLEERKKCKCYICNEILSNGDTLSLHLRKHFICDICQAQCSTQISYDKHLRLHVSTDPLLPYKCHKCPSVFEVKAEVFEHYAEKHSKIIRENRMDIANEKPKKEQKLSNKVLYRCEYCYAVFKKEESYKSHVDLHIGNGEFNCALCSKTFKDAKHLATHQERHLSGLKYTCRVCDKEFSSLETVESHMKTHMDVKREEHKCNICKKTFNNESILNKHMRGHLSRAQRCPKCHKTFINKTTLKIHFRTHTEESNARKKNLAIMQRHTCTLCTDTFETRSKLYNHIMTHLEQMHGGGEAAVGDIVFDELDDLLESDEDLL